eukprot:4101259-Amphidinium_carterae.3
MSVGLVRRLSHARSAEEETSDSGMLQWWVSTPALLVLLVYWGHKRRTNDDRRASLRLLQAILSKTITSKVAADIVHTPPPLVICSCETHGAQMCHAMSAHAAAVTKLPEVAHENCHMVLTQLLYHCMSDLGCEFLHAKFSVIVNTIAGCMNESVETWGVQQWHALPGAVMQSKVRKRPLDDEIRQEALRNMKQAKARDVGDACASLHVDDASSHRFVEKDLSLLKEACRESFQAVRHQALSLAIDGGRFRKPAQEYLLALGKSSTSNMGCFLVPAVSSCLFT